MNESFLRIKRAGTFINIVTAAAFLLFSVYHTYLFVLITASRAGRMLGIISILCFAVASVFALISQPIIRVIRTVLIIGGLSLYFIIRLFNAAGIFGRLNFSYYPSVLNFMIYVFSQSAVLVLLIYYVVFRHSQKLNSKRKTVIAMMSVVILLFVSCLAMECVLIIKYGLNIDFSLKLTLISRFLYFLGFVSMAINFTLPVQKIEDPDDLMNQPPGENDLLFSVSEGSNDKPKKNAKKIPLPADYDNDFVL